MNYILHHGAVPFLSKGIQAEGGPERSVFCFSKEAIVISGTVFQVGHLIVNAYVGLLLIRPM